MANETDTPMSTLVRSALDDVRELFREEVALARAEIRQDVSNARSAAAGLGSAAVAGWFGGLFILTAIALAIAEGLNWPTWTGFGIVGVVLAIASGVLFIAGRDSLRHIRGLPRTTETVKETFQ